MPALIISFAIALLDQITKYQVRLHFGLGESAAVIPGFFSLTYVRNTGAAWGMFGGFNAWLTLLSVVMLIVIVLFRRSFLNDTWAHRCALGLMIGGIVGNLVDRVRLFYVVDFLDFYWRNYPHFPAFNIADSAICCGVFLYMISSFWSSSREARELPPDAS